MTSVRTPIHLIFRLILTLFLLLTAFLYLRNTSLSQLKIYTNGVTNTALDPNNKCDVFRGDWVLSSRGPLYTNDTKCLIDDRQNCIKYGRPDTEFMKWRWKPENCELPLFDAAQFLEVVKGKTLAFVGDSVGRNQMQSLECLLASAANPVDISYNKYDSRFRRLLYPSHNFTLLVFWSTLLVNSQENDPNGFSSSDSRSINLYLDEADQAWASQMDYVDIVIFSAGHWFDLPLIYYENRSIIGCYRCNKSNVPKLTRFYGYKRVFRTAFLSLLKNDKYKGLTFLRTFSPSHFDRERARGGKCVKTTPFKKQEVRFQGISLASYESQVEEFRTAEREGRKKGLKFRLLDTTRAMLLRPDGHPNHYGLWPRENQTIADCVHWCLPGPIDTWNEFLLYMLKVEQEI